MKTYIDIFLMTVIVVFIIDESGFIGSIKNGLGKWLKATIHRLKPFDCSLCMTFWIGVIISIAEGQFNFPCIAYVCLCAYLTLPIKGVLDLVRDAIIKLINLINEKL